MIIQKKIFPNYETSENLGIKTSIFTKFQIFFKTLVPLVD